MGFKDFFEKEVFYEENNWTFVGESICRKSAKNK